VFLREEEAIEDLGTSISIARSDLAHALGFDGTGIDVAVWERARTTSPTSTSRGASPTRRQRRVTAV
jgi:hypothetical protein